MRYWIFLIAGTILLVISLMMFKRSLRFVQHSERVTGIVTELEAITGGDAGIAYAPVFRIITRDKHQVIYRHPSATSPASWRVGEKAVFLYDPQNPSSVRICTYFGVFSWCIILMGLAVFLVTMGGGYFVLRSYLPKV